jgi:hypothetical protein
MRACGRAATLLLASRNRALHPREQQLGVRVRERLERRGLLAVGRMRGLWWIAETTDGR